ncbi:MAG: TonB-dependent receptor [Spirosomataceae bacterium]
MKRLLFINTWLTVILALHSVSAQSLADCQCFVKGTVKDQETRKPIAGAVIVVKNTGRSTTTDSEGRYKMERLCRGTYVLECRIVGYKAIKTTISLDHSAEEDINLSEDEIHLGDVEIVARRHQAPLTQKSSLLQGAALEQTGGQPLGEVLKKITGVTVLQTGASIAKPVIHGLHSNRVLIINNGIRQEGQQWGTEHAPEIDPFIAKRVTVVKGAAGVRYGSDAIGGVILVEPEDLPKKGGTAGELTTVGFSNGRMGVVSGTLQGGIPKREGFGWRLQGTLKNGGNIRTPDYFLANTGVREVNFSMTAGYRAGQFGTEVFYSQFQTAVGIFSGSHIGSTSDLLNVIKNGEPFIKADFARQIERPYQGINHNLLKIKAFRNFNGNRLSFIAGRQFNRRAEYDLHGPLAADGPALLFRLTTFTGDLTFEHKPIAGKVTGQVGLSGLYQYNFTDGRPLIPDFEQTNLGIFWLERMAHQKWEFEAGLRYDWRKSDVFRFIGSTLDPRLHRFESWSGTAGTVYTFKDGLSFRLNFGTAWRPPNLSELYSKGVHHGAAAYEEGNDQLKPEAAYNWIGSLDFTHKRFRAELGVYHNSIRNFIYLKPQAEPILTIRGAFPYFKYVQTQAIFTGVDLDTEWEIIADKLIHTQKVAYLRAYDRREDAYLVLIPANRLENGLRWQLGKVLKFENTFLSINHLWVDKQRRVPLNSDFMPPPSAYHLWSADAGGDLSLAKNRSLHWSVTVQNLFNAAYRDYLNRFRYYAAEQGRNAAVRLKWSF